MIKVSGDLKKTLDEVTKRMRLWETWKLTSPLFGATSTWDRMSKHDQEFNVAWNKLRGIVYDTSLPKLKKILEFAESL